ncbi:FAD/NAD(P)-binding oxidoreductase [Neolewinella lacunae]|uniref:NAD(P)/FAD-dependent oxidoreductase n=1 Tax=Neolewinella lacunae TaxID=1517758 RepID=A0A923PSA0_9BACT|nr:FAD/NAD(P)-binding oxidoreductase [Neolewinella lacunae]MBC6995857.1 NAD(P)/FAD-dependent oxidoreductase [Neolewinella lacunae]MDN3636450.1 FAD/NAD(P)-binding oxidoreductase [Neolewinella lacunae]
MHVAIIGNGIAGVTAARWLRKLDASVRITLISAETEYFFSRTALMYVYMGHMRFEDIIPYEPFFWEKNRIDLLQAYVERVDTPTKTLHLANGKHLAYDKLVLATGSYWNKFGWPGQDLERVRGMVSAQDLAYLEAHTAEIKAAVVVGGGLIGIELAEMLHSRHIPVSLLIREKSYWNNALPPEESRMVSRHIRSRGIDLREETELDTIHDDGTGAAGAITTKGGERIECQFVGLTAGVSPNVAFLRGTEGLELGRGIKVNDYLETSVPDVYAIGDCAEVLDPKPGRRGVEAIWYTGRMMGETVAYNILGTKVGYDPGVWFNSAKFLDLEYQVYGEVPAGGRDGLATLYWEHPDGEKAVRINYEAADGTIRGFNLMGIRYRHEVCEKWIKEGKHVEEVLQQLGMANFDPEFYEQYEAEVVALYNQQTGKKLQLRQERSLSAALRYLGFGQRKPRAFVKPE